MAIVRACLIRWLQQHTEAADSECICRESILIRNDFYCGRQFHSTDHHAIWFIEEDELKIYDADREVVAVFSGDAIDTGAAEPVILKLPIPESDEASTSGPKTSDSVDQTRRAA